MFGQRCYTDAFNAGKSTTIFHMLNTRVPACASVLITAVRNAAVAALLDKLSRSPQRRQSLLVVGNTAKLASHAGGGAGRPAARCARYAGAALSAVVQQPRWQGTNCG
jgi:7-keto-8-aminopelargonate synthetase-like enzyme